MTETTREKRPLKNAVIASWIILSVFLGFVLGFSIMII